METKEIQQKIYQLKDEITAYDTKIQKHKNEIRLLERDFRKAKEKEQRKEYSKFLNKYFHYSYSCGSKFDVYIHVKDLSLDYDIWSLDVESVEKCSKKEGLTGFSYNKSTLIHLVSDITMDSEVKPEDLKEITKSDFLKQEEIIFKELYTLSCENYHRSLKNIEF